MFAITDPKVVIIMGVIICTAIIMGVIMYTSSDRYINCTTKKNWGPYSKCWDGVKSHGRGRPRKNWDEFRHRRARELVEIQNRRALECIETKCPLTLKDIKGMTPPQISSLSPEKIQCLVEGPCGFPNSMHGFPWFYGSLIRDALTDDQFTAFFNAGGYKMPPSGFVY